MRFARWYQPEHSGHLGEILLERVSDGEHDPFPLVRAVDLQAGQRYVLFVDTEARQAEILPEREGHLKLLAETNAAHLVGRPGWQWQA